jgi:type III pantothenate kinase
MILALDIGNTNITMGAYDGNELKFVSRLATDRQRTEDQYAVEIRDIVDIYGLSISWFEGSIISSVVPALTPAIRSALKRLTGVRPLCVGPGIKTGLNIKINDPATLGPDLVAGAVAAVKRYPCPCIIFDLGTATTISVLDRSGAFMGGAILPGAGISLDALTAHSALLASVSIEAPPHVIGASTADCMRSGSVFGTAAMMDGMCDRIEDELNHPCTVVATGGLARLMVPHCRRGVIFNDHLLLEGLRILFEKNRDIASASR